MHSALIFFGQITGMTDQNPLLVCFLGKDVYLELMSGHQLPAFALNGLLKLPSVRCARLVHFSFHLIGFKSLILATGYRLEVSGYFVGHTLAIARAILRNPESGFKLIWHDMG